MSWKKALILWRDEEKKAGEEGRRGDRVREGRTRVDEGRKKKRGIAKEKKQWE